MQLRCKIKGITLSQVRLFVMVLSGKTNFSRESCNGSFETCCNMSNSNFVRDALEGNFCDLVFEEVPVNGKLGKYVKGMGRL